MDEFIKRFSTRRNLILLGLILLFLLLLGSALYYFILRQDDPPEETVSTLYLVDASLRMSEAFSEGENSRMDVARNFVRDLVNRSPDENILGLRVFGTGKSANECEDTDLLVPINRNTQSQIADELDNVQTVSQSASLVAAALEAIRDLSESQYGGLLRLVVISGGTDDCLTDSANIIAREAELNNITLETIIISIGADEQEVQSLTSIVADLNGTDASTAVLVEANTAEEIEELVEFLDGTLNEPISTGIGGGGIEEVATQISQARTPTAVPTVTPTPTDSAPPPPPTIAITETPIPVPSNTPAPTETPTENPTETVTPSPSATSTLLPTFTATPSPTIEPTSTTGSGGSGGSNSLSITDAIANETAGSVTITVSRSGTSGAVSVNYSTTDNTATAGNDYTSANGTLFWGTGESGSKTFTILIINDNVAEVDETFLAQLSSASNASISDGSATITIQSDETAGINVNPTAAALSEASGSTTLNISLSNIPTADVTIPLTTSNGQCALAVASVVLNSTNWDTGVDITVTVDDASFEAQASDSCTVQTGSTTSTAALYSGLDGADATFTIFDDEALYVDQSCTDSDSDGVCDDGFVYRLIQTAVSASSSQTLLYVVAGTHTENSIDITRDVEVRGAGQGTTIIQGAGSAQSAADRVFTIPTGRTITLNQFTLQNGYAPTTPGGGLSNAGNLTISQLTIQSNASGTTGGGIYNTGTLNISSSILSSNQDGVGAASGFGGGLHNSGNATITSVTVSGNSSNLDASGSGRGGGLYNASGGNMTLTNSTVSNNTADQFGGGIYSRGTINISQTTINNNTITASGISGAGGGFYNEDGGILTMIDVTLDSNSVNGHGGGFYSKATGSATISRSTLSNNQTQNGGEGGGAYTAAGNTWQNVTISGNSSSGNGGGLLVSGNNATLQNVTIFNNSATSTGGGIHGDSTSQNTIIAGNTDGTGSPDCDGLLVSLDYNLVENTTNCLISGNVANNVTGVGADLGALTNNGGNTTTHLPNASSPAVDAGNPAAVTSDGNSGTCLNTDQRTITRPQGIQCDIGAVERN